ncbi:MAG: hypothetical protein AAGN66_03595 [Acidobacteriota bacterium]
MPSATEDTPKGADPADIAWRGIEHCREGDWKEGLYWLSLAAGVKDEGVDMPALFYAYLGYGIARHQGKKREGLKLCQKALDLEFYQPESYVFLAKTYLLSGDRRAAHETVVRGLQVDSGNSALLELNQELGHRKTPVLKFLPRRHFLNRILGRLRHSLSSKKKKEDDGEKKG